MGNVHGFQVYDIGTFQTFETSSTVYANVGVNSEKEFVYTSNCNPGLRVNRKNNRRD